MPVAPQMHIRRLDHALHSTRMTAVPRRTGWSVEYTKGFGEAYLDALFLAAEAAMSRFMVGSSGGHSLGQDE